MLVKVETNEFLLRVKHKHNDGTKSVIKYILNVLFVNYMFKFSVLKLRSMDRTSRLSIHRCHGYEKAGPNFASLSR